MTRAELFSKMLEANGLTADGLDKLSDADYEKFEDDFIRADYERTSPGKEFETKCITFKHDAIELAGKATMSQLDWQIYNVAVILSIMLDIRKARNQHGQIAEPTDYTDREVYSVSTPVLGMHLSREIYDSVIDNMSKKVSLFNVYDNQSLTLEHLPENLQNFAKEVAASHKTNSSCPVAVAFSI